MPSLTLYFDVTFKDENWAGLNYLLEAPIDEHGNGENGEWILGRHPANSLTIAIREISRRHASIIYSYSSNIWFLQDLGSEQGTYYKGQRLKPRQPQAIAIGDHFYLSGNRVSVVEDEQDTTGKDDGPPTLASTEPLPYMPAAAAPPPPAAAPPPVGAPPAAAPPAAAPPPPPPIIITHASYADNIQFALHWLAMPTTYGGGVIRFIVLALVALVLVLVLD
jgi:hypothetical protein